MRCQLLDCLVKSALRVSAAEALLQDTRRVCKMHHSVLVLYAWTQRTAGGMGEGGAADRVLVTCATCLIGCADRMHDAAQVNHMLSTHVGQRTGFSAGGNPRDDCYEQTCVRQGAAQRVGAAPLPHWQVRHTAIITRHALARGRLWSEVTEEARRWTKRCWVVELGGRGCAICCITQS
eukprot:365538-Chlamydomonas_euryale.AAC.6